MSEHETTPTTPGPSQGRPAGPESPGWTAWKIVSGPGTIASKRERLQALNDQHPDNPEVYGYFESLRMQEELEEKGGGGA